MKAEYKKFLEKMRKEKKLSVLDFNEPLRNKFKLTSLEARKIITEYIMNYN